MRKNWGFTLIEVILVLALLGSATAIAAPNVIDVLDDSKDKADTAQMDFLLNAFQLQQDAFFDTHESAYDMLNPNTTPEDALNAFLKDALTNPDSDVYISDVKRLKTGETPTADDWLFKAVTTDTQIWIACEHPHNESSIKLRIPNTETIDYTYLEGQPETGTWMIIGDDDRLRAEYIRSLMHMSKDQAKKEFIKNDKGKKYYRYRTSFMIEHQPRESSQAAGGDFWKLFTHQQVSGTQKIGLDLDAFAGDEDIEYRYRYIQGHKWKGDPFNYEDLDDDLETLNVAMGHTKEEAIVEFRYEDEGHGSSDYAKYGVQVFHKKDIAGTPNPSNNDASSGWIQTGANHWFYYELLEGGAQGSGGSSSGGGESGGFSYHTGMIFNYVNDNNYDFLSLEENQSGKMVLRSYRVQGGFVSGYKTEKVLTNFQFNKSYTMDLRIEKGKAIVNLSDGVLEDNTKFTIGNDLHPGIGYYMGEEEVLNGRKAISDYESDRPLIQYEEGIEEGPRLLILAMPDFYPYDSETEPEKPQAQKPEAPKLERIGTANLTINPVAFRLSTDTEGSFTMTVELPEGTNESTHQKSLDFSVDRSGKLLAYVEANGKRSDKVFLDLDNIIPPFSEIEGNYRKGYWETEFDLTNYEAVIREMEPYQKRESLHLILETRGKKYEIPSASFTMRNYSLDLDDFGIYVESEYGEILSPTAKIAQPQPPEIQLNPSSYPGYAAVTITAQNNETIEYRFLNESQAPLGQWKKYKGSFVETFAYIEARVQTSSGVISESTIEKNPYEATTIPPPEITPLENGNVSVESGAGTSIWYKNGKRWRDSYSNHVSFYLSEGETLQVYAQSIYGNQKSEEVSYTRELSTPQPPQSPTIEKPYWNRSTIIVSASEYDIIWYRYEYMQNKNKTKWTKWKSSFDQVRLNDKSIVSVEAYVEKDGVNSETARWNQ